MNESSRYPPAIETPAATASSKTLSIRSRRPNCTTLLCPAEYIYIYIYYMISHRTSFELLPRIFTCRCTSNSVVRAAACACTCNNRMAHVIAVTIERTLVR